MEQGHREKGEAMNSVRLSRGNKWGSRKGKEEMKQRDGHSEREH